jgi:hypothetical protein
MKVENIRFLGNIRKVYSRIEAFTLNFFKYFQQTKGQCGYLAAVPLGLGNAATSTGITHGGKAAPYLQHKRPIASLQHDEYIRHAPMQLEYRTRCGWSVALQLRDP